MHVRPLAAPLAVAAAAAGGCAVVWLANPTVAGGILPVCPTKALLGIDCPGCGSLRMIYSLLHLDFASAVHYNALGLVAVVLLVWAFAAWTYGRLVGATGAQLAASAMVGADGPGADVGVVCGAQLGFRTLSRAARLNCRRRDTRFARPTRLNRWNQHRPALYWWSTSARNTRS